jgi:hypothetical protein
MDSASFNLEKPQLNLEPTIKTHKVQKMVLKKDQINMLD